jgi:hypothetical protein
METASRAAVSCRSECTARLATAGPALGADWLGGAEAQGSDLAHSAGGQWGHW